MTPLRGAGLRLSSKKGCAGLRSSARFICSIVEGDLKEIGVKGLVRQYENVLRPLCAENGISKTGK